MARSGMVQPAGGMPHDDGGHLIVQVVLAQQVANGLGVLPHLPSGGVDLRHRAPVATPAEHDEKGQHPARRSPGEIPGPVEGDCAVGANRYGDGLAPRWVTALSLRATVAAPVSPWSIAAHSAARQLLGAISTQVVNAASASFGSDGMRLASLAVSSAVRCSFSNDSPAGGPAYCEVDAATKALDEPQSWCALPAPKLLSRLARLPPVKLPESTMRFSSA